MGRLVKAVTTDGCARAYAVSGTDIAERARQIHDLYPVPTAALGRALLGAAMMGATLKDDSSLTLTFHGDGPIGAICAVTDRTGNVKGYVRNPHVDTGLNAEGKLNVSAAVGSGIFTVIKDMGLKEPYVGQVPIVSGEIAEDIASYYAGSEQIPTACALGVLVDARGVRAAGGYLVQLLPCAGADTADAVEQAIKSMPPVSSLIDGGASPKQLLASVLPGFGLDILEEREVVYRCDCSKERTLRAILSLGREELAALAEKKESTEVCCHFCGDRYVFSPEELKALLGTV